MEKPCVFLDVSSDSLSEMYLPNYNADALLNTSDHFKNVNAYSEHPSTFLNCSDNIFEEVIDIEDSSSPIEVKTHSQEDLSSAGLIHFSFKDLSERSKLLEEVVCENLLNTMDDVPPLSSLQFNLSKKQHNEIGKVRTKSLNALLCDFGGISVSHNSSVDTPNKRKMDDQTLGSRKFCARTQSLKSLLPSKNVENCLDTSPQTFFPNINYKSPSSSSFMFTGDIDRVKASLSISEEDEELIPLKELKTKSLNDDDNSPNCCFNKPDEKELDFKSCSRNINHISNPLVAIPFYSGFENSCSTRYSNPYTSENLKIIDYTEYCKNSNPGSKYLKTDYESNISCDKETQNYEKLKKLYISAKIFESNIHSPLNENYVNEDLHKHKSLDYNFSEIPSSAFEDISPSPYKHSSDEECLENFLKWLNETEFKTGFIDTHCHIDFLFNKKNYLNSFMSYIDFCEETDPFPKSFEGCITVFCNPSTFFKLNWWNDILAEKNVWGAFGCHPHFANKFSSTDEDFLYYALQLDQVKAAGEFGLDYSGRNFIDSDLQKSVFIKQLNIAMKVKKPVVIHCRDAFEDCYEIMKKILPKNYKIHKHCFTGDSQEAKLWMDHFPNLYLGFTCLITQTGYRAISVKESAKTVPLNRILLETDAPYFRPYYLEKGSCSHPGMAIHVASAISKLRQISIEEVLEAARRNTREVYNV